MKIEATDHGVIIDVKVVPNASRDQIVGPLGDALKVKTAAAPEAGKANKAICGLIAKALGVAKRDVTVIAGQTQAHKRIAIAGVDEQAVKEKLP